MAWETLADDIHAEYGPSLEKLATVLSRLISQLDDQRAVLANELALVEAKIKAIEAKRTVGIQG